MVHAQYAGAGYIRSCGKVSPLSSLGAQPTMDSSERPYTGKEFLKFIPSLCVSERYDSNVYYAPPTPGLNRADFVTDVNPQVRVNHNGEYVTGYLDVGGFYEAFVRNSNLNFFGTADILYVNLDNSIKRFLPKASLSITNSLRYTPTAPGFSSTVAGTTPGSPSNIQNVYAQGFLVNRTNNVTNSGTALASYQITPLTSLNASYTNNILRWGSSPISTATLFNTTYQAGTVGTTTQLSALDTLTVNYTYAHSEFTQISGGPAQTSSFVTNMGILGWTRTLTPYLKGSLGGGVIVIDPGLTTYALNASMILNTDNYIATLSYARSSYPSVAGTAVPLVTDVVSLTAIQKLALHWELDETANYSYGSGTGGPTPISFTSYFAAVDLYYWITKSWSSALSFDYMHYSQESGGFRTEFPRYAVTFSLRATLN